MREVKGAAIVPVGDNGTLKGRVKTLRKKKDEDEKR
jgi:hypothetical protein